MPMGRVNIFGLTDVVDHFNDDDHRAMRMTRSSTKRNMTSLFGL
jgi:hypothetical protein